MRTQILLALILTGAATAQTASYTYINQTKPYSNPMVAMLKAVGVPKVGSTFTVQVPFSWRQRNGVGENVVLATGLSNPKVAVPAFQGFLFTSAEFITPTKMSPLGIPGTTTVTFQIPRLKQLLGLKLYQQVLAVSAQAPFTARLSRGGVGTIGT